MLKRLVLVLMLLALPCAAQAATRVLLVGCDVFVTQRETTPSAAQGVRQLAEALAGAEPAPGEMTVCEAGVAGVDGLAELVAGTFAGAEEGDTSIFYICTHGIWNSYEPAEGMVLLLSDGVREEGITAAGLKELFDPIPGEKLLMLDACHSGAMIGKGVYEPFLNLFAGGDYRIVCSSGGMEDSWYWRGLTEDGSQVIGGGYFSGALARGLGALGDYAADENRDGAITMDELKRYLRANHGASTAQFYPEEDASVLLRYDPASLGRGPALQELSFEPGALQPGWEISFSFTVVSRVRVAYQLVYEDGGRWDFASAPLIWDDEANLSVFGAAPGWLEPGFRERQIALSPDAGEGYVLLQVLTQEDGLVTVAGSAVLCVQPLSGDPELAVVCAESFCPAEGGELSAVVQHSLPCELTVTVENEQGETLRRLLSAEPSRPEHLRPEGTTAAWNGLLSDGTPAAPGLYRIRARTRLGGVTRECAGPWVKLLAPAGENATGVEIERFVSPVPAPPFPAARTLMPLPPRSLLLP